jgi:hypothetical protein
MNRPIFALAAALAALLAAPVTEARQKSAAIDLSTPAGASLAQRKIQCSATDNVAVTYTFHG